MASNSKKAKGPSTKKAKLTTRSDSEFINQAEELISQLIFSLEEIIPSKFLDIQTHIDRILELKKKMKKYWNNEVTPSMAAEILAEIAELDTVIKDMHTTHVKNIGGNKNRLDKEIRGHLVPNLEGTLQTMGIDFIDPLLQKKALNEAIHEHFLREGLFNVAEEFRREAAATTTTIKTLEASKGISLQEDLMKRIYFALEAYKHQDMDRVMDFVGEYRQQFQATLSPLPFIVCKLAFMQLVKGGKGTEAVRFAQANFKDYILTDKDMEEVHKLVGTLMFTEDKKSHESSSYFDESLWQKGLSIFVEESLYSLLGASRKSHLPTACEAGTDALLDVTRNLELVQTLQKNWLRMESKMEVEMCSFDCKKCQEGDCANARKAGMQKWGPNICEDPVFHSIFVCPITREQVQENIQGNISGWKYPCGHVVSKVAGIEIESRNRGMSSKCPVCFSQFTYEQLGLIDPVELIIFQ